jgi:hypothetical protein
MVASGKLCRCYENYSLCQSPPLFAKSIAKPKFLVTYLDCRFGTPRANLNPA